MSKWPVETTALRSTRAFVFRPTPIFCLPRNLYSTLAHVSIMYDNHRVDATATSAKLFQSKIASVTQCDQLPPTVVPNHADDLALASSFPCVAAWMVALRSIGCMT